MKKLLLIGLLLLSLILALSCVNQKEIASANLDSVLETQVFNLVNQARAENGFCELTHDPALYVIALDYCKEMYQDGDFTHDGFESRAALIRENGYTLIGENLARGWDSSEKLVGAWLASPTHQENIMNPLFLYTGLACYNGYVCQIFVGYDLSPFINPFGLLSP